MTKEKAKGLSHVDSDSSAKLHGKVVQLILLRTRICLIRGNAIVEV